MYTRASMSLWVAITILAILFASTPLLAEPAAVTPECNQLLQLASTMGRKVDSVFINQEVCDAYRFLLERNGSGTRGAQCYKSQTDRILKLNPQFAVGLYRALTEIEKLYGGKNIIQSGFRCDGSNGNHPRGCAVDIIWRSCQIDPKPTPRGKDPWYCSSDRYDAPEQKWIDANGKNAPYKIHLRLRKAPEGHHVEPVDTQGCITGPVVGSGDAPFSGVSDAVRRAFGMSTQQPAYSSQGAYPSQPISQGQSPISSYQPQQGIAVTTGTGATSGAGASSDSGAYAGENVDIVGVSSQIGATSGGGTTHATTAADRLEELAFGTGTNASAGTNATSVPLIVSGSNAVGITGTQNPTTNLQYASSQISPTQQTFISGDLSWQGENTLQSSGLSGWDAIFVTIKATLNRILQLLQPFGARDSFEESEEWGE